MHYFTNKCFELTETLKHNDITQKTFSKIGLKTYWTTDKSKQINNIIIF